MAPRIKKKSPPVKSNDQSFDYIKFSVDAELLRELGERLVGKPYVALGELVKNSYDADSDECIVTFEDDQIRVTDNGNGMDFEEFVGKWMRIGSTHKKEEHVSPQLKRRLTGSKGVGRLSAQFLGAKIEVLSVPRKSRRDAVQARLEWADAYDKSSLVEAGAWVRKISRKGALPKKYSHGTEIVISGLKDEWGPDLLRELANELWFLQPPPILASDIEKREQFKVSLEGLNLVDNLSFDLQTKAALENWIARLDGEIRNGTTGGKANLKLTFRDGEKYTAEFDLPHKALDEATFGIYIFKLSGRQASGISVNDAREYFKKFGGLHIYDSGFRLPYYGGDENDWLGLEIAHSHRLIVSQLVPEELRNPRSTLQDLPTLGRVLGVVQVSTPREAEVKQSDSLPGDLLQVQITRDKLIDNRAYEDLTHLVRWAFDFYSYKSTARRSASKVTNAGKETPRISVQIDTIKQQLYELKEKVPPQLVQPLENTFQVLVESETERQKTIDAERVLLAALATAGMGAVALQHELAKELGALSRVVKKLEVYTDNDTNGELEEVTSALKTWHQSASQTRKMFSPFFDIEDREKMRRVRVKRVIDRLALNLAPLLRGVKIETSGIPDTLKLPQGTLAGWNAVFQNIFVNSVNAMLNTKLKRIRCRVEMRKAGHARLIIEDTGLGIDLENAEDLFKPFIRKLDLPEDRKALGLGGMGMGLTIVRMVCQTFNCKSKFTKPRSPFKTAFEISWDE
ncbi:MAG: ATP-binding protein [Candidatus Thiodiazotropha lotti]|nr:ATP-binding protein [Candidatus Thiodiazotropha lotti]